MNQQATIMNQQQQHQQLMKNPNVMSLNQINLQQLQQSQPQMLPINRSYGVWPTSLQPQPPFQNPNPNIGVVKPPPSTFKNPLGPRSSWNGKRINNLNDKRRKEQQKSLMAGYSSGGPVGGVNAVVGGDGNLNFSNYNLRSLNELQYQNRLKSRKVFPKKKFNKNNSMNMNMGYNNRNSRSAPFAPRNTTSFLIRAKKSGGIASLVSPCPVTPAVLPTPIFSPSREVLVDMAKEEWGVDGYGSMKGLIRLRSPGHEMQTQEDEEDDDGGSSESDVEEHVEVERRLDHDLSRFEMIYNPNSIGVGGMEYHNVLENRVDDQYSHIAHLEEENMILKERLFLMERELGDLTRRLRCIERRGGNRVEDNNDEVVENESDTGSDSHESAHSIEEDNDAFSEENVRGDGGSRGNEDNDKNDIFYEKVENKEILFEADENYHIADPECKVEKSTDDLVDPNKDKKNIVLDEIERNNEDMNKCADGIERQRIM